MRRALRHITIRRARTWHCGRMRRYGEPSKDQERLLPHQFCSDCIIATRGYDFREGEAAIRRILMPLVRVTMIKGKSPDYIKKMSDSIYKALVEAYQMAENELFQIIEQLEPSDLIYDRHFGIKGSRSGDFVIINIESDARRRGEKEAFLARLSDKLAASPGIARDDVFVRLSMTAGLEDWSLGSGIAASKS